MFFTKEMFYKECIDVVNSGVFHFLSFFGKIITNKYYIFDDTDSAKKYYPKLSNQDVHYKHTEVMIDVDNTVPCIVKSFDLDDDAMIHQVFNKKVF